MNVNDPPENFVRLPFPKGATVENIALHRELMPPRLQKPIFAPVAQGSYVSVRLASSKETHLGLYLGDLPISMSAKKDGIDYRVVGMNANPCIYVFALQQFVYGAESWWGAINGPEDFKQITDTDIKSTWYVQAARSYGLEPNLGDATRH